MKKALVFIILLILAAIVMIFAVNCDNDNNEIATGDFNINGIRITAPAIFWQNTEHGETLMLPLQAIVEELGYNFSFDARSGVIQVGDAIDLSIGDDMIYFHGWLVSIGAAPMVVDNTVFVPRGFFTWLGINVRTHIGNDIQITEIRSYSESMFDWLTLRVALATEEHLRNYESYIEFIEFDEEGHQKIVIVPSFPVTSFRWLEIGYNFDDDYDFYIYGTTLYEAGEVTPEQPFVVTWIAWGTLSHRGISFVDGHGVTRYFTLNVNNADSIEDPRDMYMLVEFFQ